jgi:G3E family GTPase
VTRAADGKVPVIVLTGFLGSGKTTLLARLLVDPAFADAGVIVNEFGEVPVDHDLVEAGRPERGGGEVRVTSGGCLCCTVGSDIRSSLSDLLEAARARGRPLARVVIETTGLADPAPVVNQIVPGGAPALGLRDHTVARTFHLAGVVATVDALHAEETLASHLECVKQVAFADRILLTKGDLLDAPERMAALRGELAAINPVAEIADVHAPCFDLAAAFAPRGYAPANLGDDVLGWLALEQVLAAEGAHAGGEAPNRHGAAAIATTSLVVDAPIRRANLSMFMDVLGLTAGSKLLRLKGILCLADDPDHPYVLHAVQSHVHPITRLDAWPSDDRRTRLVAITEGLDPAALKRLFRSVGGPPPSGLAARAGSAAFLATLVLAGAVVLSASVLAAAAAIDALTDGRAGETPSVTLDQED